MLRNTCIDRKNSNAKLLKANIELWKWNNVLQTPMMYSGFCSSFIILSHLILSPKMKGSSYSYSTSFLKPFESNSQLFTSAFGFATKENSYKNLSQFLNDPFKFNSIRLKNQITIVFHSGFQSCKSKGHLKSAMLCHKYSGAPLLYDFHSIKLLFVIRIHFLFGWISQ